MRKIKLVGAGPVGSLLSLYLARRGFEVEIFERRPDMRVENISAGRSINLAVSTRGLHALREVGLEDEILKIAIPMKGRMIHALNSDVSFQPYGIDDSQCINSISRSGLNKLLMTRAESTGHVKINFNHKVEGLSEFAHDEIVIGTDGSASAIRSDILFQNGQKAHEHILDSGYKELHLPPGKNGSFQIEKNALHIWPRGKFMLIALPNLDGSFTCTLFLPFKGDVSFETLKTSQNVSEFFNQYFPDIVSRFTDLEESFFANPTGSMITVKCSPWHLGGRALLVGDAAHAIVPFYGQGMNCGFEDCFVLDQLMNRLSNWEALFSEFSRTRRLDSDAIADMAVENFVEMRDKVSQPKFLLEKAVEKLLLEKFPHHFVSRYSIVTFSRAPYRLGYDAGIIANEILSELCRDIDKPQEVDFSRAQILIEERLDPLLRQA